MMIPRRIYDIIIEICCIICIIGVLLFLIINWNSIPEKIPGHYNAAGQIDRVTGKSSLIVLFVVNWIMYIGMTIIEKFPQIWNTGVKLTEENKYRVLRILKDILKSTKLMTIVIFSFLIIYSALALPLPTWFLPVILILMFGFEGFLVVRLLKNK